MPSQWQFCIGPDRSAAACSLNQLPLRKRMQRHWAMSPCWILISPLTSKKSSRAASHATFPHGTDPRLQHTHCRRAARRKPASNPQSCSGYTRRKSSPRRQRLVNMEIRPIKNDKDHERALLRVEQLWGSVPGSPGGDELSVLVTKIEAWEERTYPIDFPRPNSPPMIPPESPATTTLPSAPP